MKPLIRQFVERSEGGAFEKEGGVSEVLGFLLIIAVSFVVFSAFMQTVVPGIVSSNEAQHYQEVVGQVYSIKSTLMNALSLRLYPNQLYVTLSLGVQTFPVFIPPSEGQLSVAPFDPNLNFFNVSFTTLAGTQKFSSGLTFYVSLYNHAYPSQEVIFDNGMIATGQLNSPNLSVISNGTVGIYSSSMTLILFEDIGNGFSYTSSGSVGVSILVTSISSSTYSISSGPVTITIHSPLSSFWANYIKSLAPSQVQVSQSNGNQVITVSGINTITIMLMVLVVSTSGSG